jgi:hypothetical protein
MDPTRPTAPRRWIALAVVAAPLIALLAAASLRGTGPVDDDYIIYRYARNLAAGHGLVYNAGQRVEGFTSPGWTLLLALAISLGGAAASVSVVASWIGSALAALFTALQERVGRSAPRMPWSALLVAVSPAMAYHANAGLGTTATAAALVTALWAHRRAERRNAAPILAALLYGLASLLRPEAFLFCALFALASAVRRRFVAAALALLPTLGWVGFRLLYYGRLLPVTYEVKKLPLLVDLGYGLEYLLEASVCCGVGILLLLSLLAWWRGRSELDVPERLSLAGTWTYVAAVVYVGGDYMPLARFFLPVYPLLAWFGVLGLRAALRARPRALRIATGALVVAALWPHAQRGELYALYRQNEARWIRIGKSLAARAPAGSSLALAPIGAVGYHSELEILDFLGLTNDVVLESAPDLGTDMKGHQRTNMVWILAQEPDYVIIGNGVFLEGSNTIPAFPGDQELLSLPGFAESYRPMGMPIQESYPLVLFVRRGSTPPVGAQAVNQRG